jgi:uncharacterized protein (DUF433 family)
MAKTKSIRIAYSPEPATALDVRELPLYSLAEVAYYVGIPKTTIHRWTRGGENKRHGKYAPLIEPADRNNALFSFYNLSEAHILSVTTRVSGIRLVTVRNAVEEVKRLPLSNPNHPLLSEKFWTDGRDLFVKFIERKSRLTINVSQFGQLGLREILDSYLERIDRDKDNNPIKLFPVRQPGRVVAIIPAVSSGRPIIDGTGIPVATIWNRHNAGDSVEYIADDYEIPESQIEGAIQYIEQRLAA